MRMMITSLLIYVAVLSLSAWGQNVNSESDQPRPKVKPSDLLHTDIMVATYKGTKNLPEGKIRPRLLAFVIFVADPVTFPGLDVSSVATKCNLPYYDGARGIMLLTLHGWRC